MSENTYELRPIPAADSAAQAGRLALLRREGIDTDAHIDLSLGLYHGDKLAATGSIFRNTLRCLAVDSAYRGQNLLGRLVNGLSELLYAKGIYDLFLYTKPENRSVFRSLGFYEIAATECAMLLESRKDGFSAYLSSLERTLQPQGQTSMIVMNANPFTNGHRYLVETAARSSDRLCILVVSEDLSLIPFSDRLALVQAGTAHLPNVRVTGTGPYLISSAVFPTYFLGGSRQTVLTQARLDAQVFLRIANTLGISRRYLGEEPLSPNTALYNEALCASLSSSTVQCQIIPRLTVSSGPVSASAVRRLIHDGRIPEIRGLVPDSTYQYFLSPRGRAAIAAIQRATAVEHG